MYVSLYDNMHMFYIFPYQFQSNTEVVGTKHFAGMRYSHN